MKRSKLGVFIDNTTITLLGVIISFFLIKKYVFNFWTSICLSLAFGFVIIKILLHFQNKKYTKLAIEKQEVSNIDTYNFELRKLNKNEQIDFFYNTFFKMNPIKTPHGIVIKNKIYFHIVLDKDTLQNEDVFFAYSQHQQLQKDLKLTIEEAVIICNKNSQETTSTMNKFNILFTIFSPIETYAMLKNFNHLPPIQTTKKTQKVNKFSFIKHVFVQKQAKNFLKSSLFIFLTSIFLPYTFYYLLTAGILLLISVLCFCFGEKSPIITPLSKRLILENNQ